MQGPKPGDCRALFSLPLRGFYEWHAREVGWHMCDKVEPGFDLARDPGLHSSADAYMPRHLGNRIIATKRDVHAAHVARHGVCTDP